MDNEFLNLTEAQKTIDRQSTIYYEIQEQSRSIVRFIFTLLSISVAFAALLLSEIIGILPEIPIPPTEFETTDQIRVFGGNLLVSFLLVLLGIFFFLKSLYNSLNILGGPNLKPVSIRQNTNIHLTESSQNYPDWIMYNRESLREKNELLEKCYHYLRISPFLIVFGVALYFFPYGYSPQEILLLHTTILSFIAFIVTLMILIEGSYLYTDFENKAEKISNKLPSYLILSLPIIFVIFVVAVQPRLLLVIIPSSICGLVLFILSYFGPKKGLQPTTITILIIILIVVVVAVPVGIFAYLQ